MKLWGLNVIGGCSSCRSAGWKIIVRVVMHDCWVAVWHLGYDLGWRKREEDEIGGEIGRERREQNEKKWGHNSYFNMRDGYFNFFKKKLVPKVTGDWVISQEKTQLKLLAKVELSIQKYL